MSSSAGYATWGLLAAYACALAVLARSRAGARASSVASPGEVLARLATGPVLRIALVLAWMWVGWHLFVR